MRRLLLLTLLFVLAPMACDSPAVPTGGTFAAAVARVRGGGITTEERAAASALADALNEGELTYMASFDWSALTAEQMAADPIFQRAFAATDPVLAASLPPNDWSPFGTSVAHAACTLAPVSAECREGLWRALSPAIGGGVLLTQCGGLAGTVVGLPLAAVCTGLALRTLHRAAQQAGACSTTALRQLSNLLDCVEPDADASEYIDLDLLCRSVPTEPECRTDAGGIVLPDAGGRPFGVDSGFDAGDAGALCPRVPVRDFGTNTGDRAPGFTLPQCDGASYDLYGADFCDPSTSFTVLNFAAEWHGFCQEESRLLTDVISRPYARRGVRVIQILIQDADYGPPGPDLCQRWVERFGLTDNVEVFDTYGTTTELYSSSALLPRSLILDATGTIVYQESGTYSSLMSLRAALEAALAGRL